METKNFIPLKEILINIGMQNFWCYLLLAFFFTLLIRAILCFFKAHAIINGEIDDSKESNEEVKWRGRSFNTAFKCSFCGGASDIRIDDYWLPAIIGLSELLIYPVLMNKGWWAPVATWIAIKTASSWGGWQKTRTAYNRFLLGNILSLTASVIICIMCFT